MSTKTEDEIAREKDMVAKMIGTKTAMEAALSRIARLEKTMRDANVFLDEMRKVAGDHLAYKTYHHTGSNNGSAEYVKVSDQIKRIHDMMRNVL